MASREIVHLADGSVRYKYKIRRKLPDGRMLTRVKQFRTDKAGQRWARGLEAQLDAGKAVPDLAEAKRTFGDLSARYRRDILIKYDPTEQKLRDTRLAWWEERLAHVRLSGLGRPLLLEQLEALERGEGTPRGPVGPATRNRYIGVLRHVLGAGVRWEWMNSNPASRLSRPKQDQEPPGRSRYLSDGERERLLVACEAEDNVLLAPLVKLALYTGCRRGEILGLRWREVDFKRRQLALVGDDGVRRTKSRHGRSVALSASAIEVLQQLRKKRRLDSDLVFTNAKGGQVEFPRGAFGRALEQAGVENFRFHDLRHTFASYLLMSGASLAELAEALGHRTLAMVKRYAHLSRAHAATVVERMDTRLQEGGFG